MSETALVIINMQSVRASKETDYYLGNMHVMLEKMNYLIAYAREMGYKIIFVKHLEASGAFSERSPLSEFFPDCAQGIKEVQILYLAIQKYLFPW